MITGIICKSEKQFNRLCDEHNLDRNDCLHIVEGINLAGFEFDRLIIVEKTNDRLIEMAQMRKR